MGVTITIDQNFTSESQPSIRIQGLKEDVYQAGSRITGMLFNINAERLEHEHRSAAKRMEIEHKSKEKRMEKKIEKQEKRTQE